MKSDLEFKRYIKAGAWRCPAGGAHFWVSAKGITWQCTKCGAERQFPVPSYGHGCYWGDREFWRGLGLVKAIAQDRYEC